MDTFGKRIKKCREALDMTQTQLSEKLGKVDTDIILWEQEKHCPDSNALVKLSEIFNVSTDYLLCTTDDPTPYKDLPLNEQIIVLHREGKEGLDDYALSDILSYVKFKYPDKFNSNSK